jgi:aryl-alcohol dehydrogenase-like predicted oxidoreductase
VTGAPAAGIGGARLGVDSARRIGESGVSAVGIGGARWSLTDHPDEDTAVETLCAALDLGITVIDTAPAYTTPTHPAHNEELIGGVLDRLGRPDVFVVTKGGHYRDGATAFPIDGRPETIHRQCRESLARLRMDRIDLYLLHWPDPAVDLAQSVGALAELREQGLVRMVGVCNVGRDQLATARAVTEIDAVQNRLSVVAPQNLPVLADAAAAGIAHLCYSPLGGPGGARTALAGIEPVVAVARERAATVHQIAIAWLLALATVTIPLVGAGRPRSVADAVAAARIVLTPDELTAITAAATAGRT